jgi:hypothetical protein
VRRRGRSRVVSGSTSFAFVDGVGRRRLTPFLPSGCSGGDDEFRVLWRRFVVLNVIGVFP